MNVNPLRSLRRLVLGVSPQETSFAKRGFELGEITLQSHLEGIGEYFVRGYNLALAHYPDEELYNELDCISAEFSGFAYEGAAMALMILDLLTPWRRNRWKSFLDGPARNHDYMSYVGAGWALARLKKSPAKFLANNDSPLRWLALDGYGFHHGFFDSENSITRQTVPAQIEGYMRKAFDQGLGRSLWFVKCANVENITESISAFHPDRRSDLWSGLGLASAYAGGVRPDTYADIKEQAREFYPVLAQGVAFAAKARIKAGNLGDHTEVACDVICGMSADEAARITDTAALDLPVEDRSLAETPAYEVWRKRVQAAITEKNAENNTEKNTEKKQRSAVK